MITTARISIFPAPRIDGLAVISAPLSVPIRAVITALSWAETAGEEQQTTSCVCWPYEPDRTGGTDVTMKTQGLEASAAQPELSCSEAVLSVQWPSTVTTTTSQINTLQAS